MEGRRASATTTSPVAFGEDPQLLGMLTVPEPGAAVHRRGVVICAPFGHEHTRAFRPLRTLAERIAESGWPVLRFDWPSSGDSGDAAPGSRVDMRAWTLSVQQAIDTLRERTKVDVVTIVGLRIGASIGLLAGTAEPTVSEIVLLAPFTTGRAYLDAMRAYDVATGHLFSEPAGPVPPVPEGAIEASGFLMSAGEVRALESLDLARSELSSLSVRRALLVAPEHDPAFRALADQLDETVPDVTNELCPELELVWASTNSSVLPHSCTRLICEWLAAGRSDGSRRASAGTPRGEAVVLAAGRVREETMVLETARGRRFATLCEHADHFDADDAWIVFLNAARVRRAGPSRLWTAYARTWAQAGLPSLRLDSWGAGESDGNRVLDELPVRLRSQYYLSGIGRDVSDALSWLASYRGARRFALIGLCSGAYWGFHTALADERVAGVALVNPRRLYWDRRPVLPRHALSDTRLIARNPRLWRHALHAGGRPPVGEILLGGALELLARGGRTSHEGRILEALDRLGARNTSALLVLSGGDRGIGYFERHIGLDYRPVLERHGVTTEIIRGPDHTFRPLWSHEALRRVLEAQLHRIEFLEIDEASNVERRSGVGRDRA